MLFRTKLTVGLGFLFLIIFALAILSSYEIQGLSREADSILKDNYNSLVYCKGMLVALDDMRTAVSGQIFVPNLNKSSDYYANLFEASKSTFESNLHAEKNNITEVHEKEYVAELNSNYGLFLNLCLQANSKGGGSSFYFSDFIPAYMATRQTIVQINDINMQAIERKNLSTRNSAGKMTVSIAASGALAVLLAFFYFWYFPFYVSNSISYLAKKMKELLQSIGITLNTKTNDEAMILLQSIDLLENELVKNRRVPMQ